MYNNFEQILCYANVTLLVKGVVSFMELISKLLPRNTLVLTSYMGKKGLKEVVSHISSEWAADSIRLTWWPLLVCPDGVLRGWALEEGQGVSEKRSHKSPGEKTLLTESSLIPAFDKH